jgi:peptide-methionine (S)-S-oxide reductase
MALTLFVGAFYLNQSAIEVQNKIDPISVKEIMENNNQNLQVATFGGGCFWCVEAVFQRLEGVHKVESGYSGGHVKNPSYREICGKQTGHAEVTQIHFDPNVISFEELLEVFWYTHDPTTLDRQGNDVGPQYRSVIFYHNEQQKLIAEKSKAETATQMWHDAIVTEIGPLINFYPAENYHQNYYNNNSYQGYCMVVINPKVAKLKAKYASRLKKTIK